MPNRIKYYEFISNNFELPADKITEIYKQRWQIETLFKQLKPNFPLKYFLGDNQNAIEIQIWCALIGLLLLSVIHQNHQSTMAFTVFTTIIRLHLFNYIGLKERIESKKTKKRARQTPGFRSF